mgnify:CR=1 FL=1
MCVCNGGSSCCDGKYPGCWISKPTTLSASPVSTKTESELPKIISHQPEEIVALLSDLQPGLRTPTYDVGAFRVRFDRWVGALKRLYTIHSTDRAIPKLWIAAGGDFIEGEPFTHRINLAEMDADSGGIVDILRQKRLVQDVVAAGIAELCEIFGAVELVGVAGNHGAARHRDASRRSNDDLEVYYSIGDRLAGTKNFTLTVDPTKFYAVFRVCGHPLLLVHGHQIKMWSRTPLYGIVNMVTLWHQVIPEPFEYVLMGHFHSLQYTNAVGTPVYLNGAFVYDDEFSMSRGLKASAQQWVIGIHPKYGVTWERRVWLKS